jgi:hypothetical protein
VWRRTISLCAVEICVRVYVDEADGLGIYLLEDQAPVAGDVNATLMFSSATERVIVQQGVMGLIPEQQHSFIERIPKFWIEFCRLFYEARGV